MRYFEKSSFPGSKFFSTPVQARERRRPRAAYTLPTATLPPGNECGCRPSLPSARDGGAPGPRTRELIGPPAALPAAPAILFPRDAAPLHRPCERNPSDSTTPRPVRVEVPATTSPFRQNSNHFSRNRTPISRFSTLFRANTAHLRWKSILFLRNSVLFSANSEVFRPKCELFLENSSLIGRISAVFLRKWLLFRPKCSPCPRFSAAFGPKSLQFREISSQNFPF